MKCLHLLLWLVAMRITKVMMLEKNKELGAEAVIKKKRQKTSTVWNDFDEVEIPGVEKKGCVQVLQR